MAHGYQSRFQGTHNIAANVGNQTERKSAAIADDWSGRSRTIASKAVRKGKLMMNGHNYVHLEDMKGTRRPEPDLDAPGSSRSAPSTYRSPERSCHVSQEPPNSKRRLKSSSGDAPRIPSRHRMTPQGTSSPDGPGLTSKPVVPPILPQTS